LIFEPASIAALNAQYPDQPAPLRHQLGGRHLLTLSRLAELAASLPPACVEYNAGDLPIDQNPDLTPMNGLSLEDTIVRITTCDSWMALKNIEQDPAYGALLSDCLADIEPHIFAASGAMHRKEGFIFISSPNAVTPFHMDPEHNILMQVCGSKTMRIYPRAGIVSAEQHEAFHSKGGHRNLDYQKTFERQAAAFKLQPGDAVYVPVKAPHWVQNGDAVSVSLSITWRSRLSDDEARLHRANAWLRRYGAHPSPPETAPLRGQAKVLAHRLASRITRR